MYFDTAVHLIASQKGDNRLECFSNMLSCWKKFLHLIWSQYLPSIRPEAIYGHVIKVLRKCGDVEIAVVWYWAPLRAQSEWWGQTWASVEVTGCSEHMLVPGTPCPIHWASRGVRYCTVCGAALLKEVMCWITVTFEHRGQRLALMAEM